MGLKFLGITVSSLVNSNQNTQLCQIWSNMKMSNYPAKNEVIITALFNNTRTLKLKAQPTNAFFAAVNQVFGGSSQLTTTAELCSLSELCTTIWPTARSTAVESWEEPANIWLTVAKDPFVGWALNFRVRMLLRGAVNNMTCVQSWT